MNIEKIISCASTEKTIRLYWFMSNNIGDSINVWLIEKISGKRVVFGDNCSPHFLCVGSILNWANENSCVWGAGLASSTDCVNQHANILAVRGPLSRSIAINNGCQCPEVYGDPALLVSMYYTPKTKKNKYEIGIIPHYVDAEVVNNLPKVDEVKIINVFDSVEKFLDDVWSCKYILSSSLHGLIIANSYGKKSLHVKITNKILGDGIKYSDYFNTVGIRSYQAVPLSVFMDDIKSSIQMVEDKSFEVDTTKLVKNCPF